MSLYRWTAYLLWGAAAVVTVILLSEEVPAVAFAIAISGALTGIFFLALDDIIAALGGRPTQIRRRKSDEQEPAKPEELTNAGNDFATIRAELARLKERV